MQKPKNQVRSQKEILDEIKLLSERSKQTSSRQLEINSNDNLIEDLDLQFQSITISDRADPDTSHRIYYGIRRLLIQNLPRGKENLKLRKYIYGEKSLFLNRGREKNDFGIRGSDERMTYINAYLKVILTIIIDWIRKGADYLDLYQTIYDLNEKRGFHKIPSNK